MQRSHRSLQEKYLKLSSEKRKKPQEELLNQAREMKQQKIEREKFSAKHYKLKKHLMCATWKKGPTGKIQVSPKEEMRKKIKESPDLADAVIFAFAEIGEADLSACYDCDFITFKNVSWS